MVEGFATGFEERGLAALGGSEEVRADVHRKATGLVLAARGLHAERRTVTEALPHVAVPTLVIVGEHDVPFVGGPHYMADKIPGARLLVIPGAAHAPNIEQPELFATALTEFLDSLPRSASY